MVRSAAAEHPMWTLRIVDTEIAAGPGPRALPPSFEEAPPLVALRGGRRLAQEWLPAISPSRATPFVDGLTYVIVGGAGGLGFALSRQLAAAHGVRLGWIGRRPLDADIERQMRAVEELGATVCYEAGDLGDRASIERAVRAIRSRLGPISGAVHSAMVLDDVSVVAVLNAY